MTKTKSVFSVEKLMPAVKPFTSKSVTRPILSTALITEEYVMAKDSHRAVRIRHDSSVPHPRLFHFKNETAVYEASNYPKLEKLFPNSLDAQETITIKVAEWIEAHEAVLVAAKEHNNLTTYLRQDKIIVKAATVKTVKGKKTDYSPSKGKGYKDIKVPAHEQLEANYTLDKPVPFAQTAYNCKFMLDLMKLAKKLKIKELDLHFYGNMRPMYFTALDFEALILPLRTY